MHAAHRSPKDRHPAGTELWSRKHAPKEEAQLIVHKKKLAELREFLRASADNNGANSTSKLLLVSGDTPRASTLSKPPIKAAFFCLVCVVLMHQMSNPVFTLDCVA